MYPMVTGMRRWLWRAFAVSLVFALLIFADGETQSFTDVFQLSNLFALLLYLVPTLAICTVLDRWFSAVHPGGFFWSLLLGIPAGFLIVAVILGFAMGRVQLFFPQ